MGGLTINAGPDNIATIDITPIVREPNIKGAWVDAYALCREHHCG